MHLNYPSAPQMPRLFIVQLPYLFYFLFASSCHSFLYLSFYVYHIIRGIIIILTQTYGLVIFLLLLIYCITWF